MKAITLLLVGAAILALSSACDAQTFNQVIVFGDSSVDAGYYKALPSPGSTIAAVNTFWPSAVAAGAGVQTTSPGLTYAQYLASYFGLTATPANQPGGTNYANDGAKNVTINTAATGGFTAAVPIVTQIANYLAANGGRANANALYIVASGGNDICYALSNGCAGTAPYPTNPTAYLTSAANSLATAIVSLSAAGGRYFVVPNQAYSFPPDNPTFQQLRLTYSNSLWTALTTAGINYIQADFNAILSAIQSRPADFGIITGVTPACTQPAGVSTAWALLCSTNPSAPSQLVSPNAADTHLFADDAHFSTAGQKLLARYYYSQIVKTWGTTTAPTAPVNGAGYSEIAPIFDGSDGNQSFIRLDNAGPAATTFNITVVGTPSGAVYGTAAIQVPIRASPQYSLSQILTAAKAGAFTKGDTGYSLYLRDVDLGLSYQHVIYNDGNGFFENVTTCKFATSDDRTGLNNKLMNVHTSRLSGYPAQIAIHNYTTAAATYNVTIRDSATGIFVGTVPVTVGANATYSIPFAYFEQQLNWTPSASQVHANMLFAPALGVEYYPEVSAYIYNSKLSAYVSMTHRCAM